MIHAGVLRQGSGERVAHLGGEELPSGWGGPLRAPRYLGNLGGLDAYRKLVVLELPPKRVDRIVADLEALRTHLGQDRLDLLAHSAAGNLALQYAAAHPDRIGKVTLVTPGTRAVGIEPSEDDWHAALGRRSDEPWYPDALKAINAWDAGDTSSATQFAAMPFFYGRWDASAQAHAIGEAQEATPDAAAIYYADGAPDPETTSAAGDASGCRSATGTALEEAEPGRRW